MERHRQLSDLNRGGAGRRRAATSLIWTLVFSAAASLDTRWLRHRLCDELENVPLNPDSTLKRSRYVSVCVATARAPPVT
jgi:hypothetical protein